MKRAMFTTGSNSEISNKKVALVERNDHPGGITLVNSCRIAKKNCDDLVELAMEIEKADSYVSATTSNKLQVIAEQMTFLKQQALNILQEAKKNSSLHHTACNFKKIPGNVYYLYKRPSGQQYFSMLSPNDWGTCPHEYLGAYRLEADQSWTPEDKIEIVDKQMNQIKKLLNTNESSYFAAITQPMDIL